MSDALAEVQGIVKRITGARRVDANARLYHDLGVDGDDAYEMLEEIARRFGVSFDGFQFDRYFTQETEALGAHVRRLLGRPAKREPLTVHHLASIVQDKAWFEPGSMSD